MNDTKQLIEIYKNAIQKTESSINYLNSLQLSTKEGGMIFISDNIPAIAGLNNNDILDTFKSFLLEGLNNAPEKEIITFCHTLLIKLQEQLYKQLDSEKESLNIAIKVHKSEQQREKQTK